MQIPGLYVGPSLVEGRGVFCQHPITQDSVIEICPTLDFPADASIHLNKTNLFNYLFEWGEDGQSTILLLGFGSLYNHSYQPNAQYIADAEHLTFTIQALVDIPPNTEITFNYNGEPNDLLPLWFETS